MRHVVYDGFQAYRSRLDDYHLIHEFLTELPHLLGVQAVMPPMLIPYYNGVRAQDCGISSFVFLAGGHITLHTFSYREALFADIVSPEQFEAPVFIKTLQEVFPCKVSGHQICDRQHKEIVPVKYNEKTDFGPHLFTRFQASEQMDLDQLFAVFDILPQKIGMTPIMRPYVIRTMTKNGQAILSAMTMIAESHISLHYFEETQVAYFDLFSCSPFDENLVLKELRYFLKDELNCTSCIARGSNYSTQKTRTKTHYTKSRAWSTHIINQGENG